MTVLTYISALNGIAQLGAARLLDSLVQGAVLAGIAALLLMFSRRQGARIRFVIWFSALIGIVGDAVLGVVWPHGIGQLGCQWVPTLSLPDQWGLYLFGVWAVFAGLGLARVAAAIWRVRVLRRTCVPVDLGHVPAEVRETFARFQPRRSVTLNTSTKVEAPTTIGFLHPAVVIPTSLLDELSREDLQHIIIHELTHVRRWDDWSNLAQKVVRALLFFHPVVWWLEPRISLEREMACDEAVVAATSNPRAYAQCLALLAERGFVRRSLALVQGAVGRMRHTTARVMTILDGKHSTPTPMWKAAVPAIAVFLGASVMLMARLPDVVAFQGPARLVATQSDSGIGSVATATPVTHHATTVAARALNQLPERPHATLASARVRRPAVAMVSSRLSHVNRARAKREIVLVVFAERPLPRVPVWQLRVWQVTLVRQMSYTSTKQI